jgi:hypothetical protein
MALSNTNTFTVTRDDVIAAVLRVLGVIGAGETSSIDDKTNCSQALNIMLKSWSKKGIPLWVTSEVSFPVIKDIKKYNLGPLGGSLTTNGITITNGGTGTDGTYALGIADATGTGATGTYIILGGVLTAIEITNGGTGYTSPTLTFPSGATSGITTTTLLVGKSMSRPLKLFNAVLKNDNNVDVILNEMARVDYVNLGNKESVSIPTQYFFDSQIETASFYLTQLPPENDGMIYAQIQRQFYDMTNGTDNFDFPQSWFQAIKWGLAAEVCTEYNIDKEMIPYYEQKASTTLMEAFDESVEETSVYFTYRDHS